MRTLLSLFIICLFSIGTVYAADVTVSDDLDFDEFQSIISARSPGDTIWVEPGVKVERPHGMQESLRLHVPNLKIIALPGTPRPLFKNTAQGHYHTTGPVFRVMAPSALKGLDLFGRSASGSGVITVLGGTVDARRLTITSDSDYGSAVFVDSGGAGMEFRNTILECTNGQCLKMLQSASANLQRVWVKVSEDYGQCIYLAGYANLTVNGFRCDINADYGTAIKLDWNSRANINRVLIRLNGSRNRGIGTTRADAYLESLTNAIVRADGFMNVAFSHAGRVPTGYLAKLKTRMTGHAARSFWVDPQLVLDDNNQPVMKIVPLLEGIDFEHDGAIGPGGGCNSSLARGISLNALPGSPHMGEEYSLIYSIDGGRIAGPASTCGFGYIDPENTWRIFNINNLDLVDNSE